MGRFWTRLDEGPEASAPFPSPFDELGPSALAQRAAAVLQAELAAGREGLPASILHLPDGGKMFGVLVAESPSGEVGFLRAFSGTIEGRFDVPGFVPPIFDREARQGFEPEGERVVKLLTARAEAFEQSEELAAARARLAALVARQEEERAALRGAHAAGRAQRRASRVAMLAAHEAGAALADGPRERDLLALAEQSRRDKADRRRLEAAHAEARAAVEAECHRLDRRLAAHARLRRMVSRRLMQRIHDTYVVTNARGETRSLRALFAPGEPPGGTGDCAAPKLLAFAYAADLRPLALAEFWWGAAPASGGRASGQFYPACRDKCGPLLAFMLQGLDVAPARRFSIPDASGLALPVVFEDEHLLVVDKPAGLLSVPPRGDAAGDCVATRLRESHGEVLVVHRLDLDTSGLMVVARDKATHAALQKQFLLRRVDKRYVAVVEGDVAGEAGTIELGLRVDVEDRPRQIVDPVHGRKAVTDWKVLGRFEDAAGRRLTSVALFPRTGRTHQLRVHAAHPLGLGAPIVGDRLYGHGGSRALLN
ncbi:MAG: RluA family pseudouridine synthase, partial [Candidatus Binatia bacterium]